MMDEQNEWRDCWRELRERRVIAALATCGLVVAWIIFGAPGLLAGFVAVVGAYWRLRSWPCPRCHRPIVGAGFATFTDRCASCGLKVFGHFIDIQQPAEPDPAAFWLSRRRRRFIAGYEIVAGALLMVLSAFGGGAWWQLLMLEGLAGLSLAAGVWLWADDARGYALTRTLQVIQLVQVQSPWLTYLAACGATFELSHVSGNVAISPGFNSKFALVFMPGQPFGVAVNLWAALLLLVLLHAKPRPAEMAPVAEPVLSPSPLA
jgi:uncharacterized protein (DUF983 family)